MRAKGPAHQQGGEGVKASVVFASGGLCAACVSYAPLSKSRDGERRSAGIAAALQCGDESRRFPFRLTKRRLASPHSKALRAYTSLPEERQSEARW